MNWVFIRPNSFAISCLGIWGIQIIDQPTMEDTEKKLNISKFKFRSLKRLAGLRDIFLVMFAIGFSIIQPFVTFNLSIIFFKRCCIMWNRLVCFKILCKTHVNPESWSFQITWVFRLQVSIPVKPWVQAKGDWKGIESPDKLTRKSRFLFRKDFRNVPQSRSRNRHALRHGVWD